MPPSPYSDDDDFLDKKNSRKKPSAAVSRKGKSRRAGTPPPSVPAASHKGKGVGKGKSRRAATPPPSATSVPASRSASGPSSSGASNFVAAPPTSPSSSTVQEPADENRPVNADSRISDADRGAKTCEDRVNELTEQLKKQGLTLQDEQKIMDEIALQTAQLEVIFKKPSYFKFHYFSS